jgi:hypothetical protein
MMNYLGIVVLLHAAYSNLHYRSILSSSTLDLLQYGINPTSPPIDVVLEVLIGFSLCLVATLIGSGPFTKVIGEGRDQIKAPLHISRDFDLFCTRAKFT